MKLGTKIGAVLLGLGLMTSMAFADGSKCGAGKCGGDMNVTKGKCGAGKCGGDMKAKPSKCGAGKCGS